MAIRKTVTIALLFDETRFPPRRCLVRFLTTILTKSRQVNSILTSQASLYILYSYSESGNNSGR